MTTEDFIKKAKYLHNDKYDYSKTVFINKHTKVCVTCKTHGDFYVLPFVHIRKNGTGCPKCSIEKRKLTIEQFIQRAKEVHRK